MLTLTRTDPACATESELVAMDGKGQEVAYLAVSHGTIDSSVLKRPLRSKCLRKVHDIMDVVHEKVSQREHLLAKLIEL